MRHEKSDGAARCRELSPDEGTEGTGERRGEKKLRLGIGMADRSNGEVLQNKVGG